MKTILLLGRNIELSELSKSQLKGITIGESLAFRFFEGEVNSESMLFVEPKKKVPTPRSLSITSSRLAILFKKAVVFILSACPAYERQRIIDKGVFFIVSDKFAHLPNLVMNERIRMTAPSERLTPVAQYLLFYHLQVKSIEGCSAMDLKSFIPYSYASITLGLTCLEELGLAEKILDGTKNKSVHFALKGKDLWNASGEYLINPVKQRIYGDELKNTCDYPICGINALSHYTTLNPDPEKMLMVTESQWKDIRKFDLLVCPNRFDGNVIIEVWKYPSVKMMDENSTWVDRLSLAISLREDEDPRVEGAVKQLIDETRWKD